MKTAISLPDDVFAAAEQLASELGLSRSGLYALAVGDLVARHRRGGVTAQLDAVYGPGAAAQSGAQGSGLDPVLAAWQADSVDHDESW